MNPLKRAANHIQVNIAEYYTLFVIVVALPLTVGYISEPKWGVLLSFFLQALIGALYIRGQR